MSTDIEPVALNSYYPCCDRHARFSAEEKDLRIVQRTCDHCNIKWEVRRTFGVDGPKGRIDRLTWVVA